MAGFLIIDDHPLFGEALGTPEQMRVLLLIARGLQNREIAAELKLAESVKAHVLFSRNKAIIEVGKISLPTQNSCPKVRANRENQP
jgi:FixJ family two-component response regulator